MNTLNELLEDQLKDLYSAEKQLIKALPVMARKASTETLKTAITEHLHETNEQAGRLEQIAGALGISLKGKICKAMQGLVEEGEEVMREKGDTLVLDAALIAAAQRVEHYEISAYGSARALAEKLGHAEAVTMLQATLDEESAADEKLNAISLEEILPEAPYDSDEAEDESAEDAEDEEDEDDEEDDEEEDDEGAVDEEEEPAKPAPKKTAPQKTAVAKRR
jgi:ferritin-like metal-binding protein YciE